MSSVERYEEALSSFKSSTVLQDFSLAGRVIVVTGSLLPSESLALSETVPEGGASGIGLALSQAVVEVGGSVAAIGAAKEPDIEFQNVFGLKVESGVKYYT